MPVGFYMDVHVPQAITEQLRLRKVDVITAQEDGRAELFDDQLLLRSSELGRVMFTHDIRFHAMACQWQRIGREFGGLIYGDQTGVGIGPYVRDLEMIAFASEPDEWKNATEPLPFR